MALAHVHVQLIIQNILVLIPADFTQFRTDRRLRSNSYTESENYASGSRQAA